MYRLQTRTAPWPLPVHPITSHQPLLDAGSDTSVLGLMHPAVPMGQGPEAKASPHGSLLPLFPRRHGAHQSLGPSPPPARGHPPAQPQCPLRYQNSSGSRGEHTNDEKWIFPVRQNEAEVCNVTPRHH